MKVDSIRNTNYNIYNQANIKPAQKSAVTEPVVQNTVNSNYLHFTGWFRRNKKATPFEGDEHGMSGNDYTISFKVADIMHRLDNESVLLIGRQNGHWTKGLLRGQLTNEDSKLRNPKDIKNVYMINYDSVEPVIIQKQDNKNILILGGSRNLTKEGATSEASSIISHSLVNHAEMGDVIETRGYLKIKFFKLPKESNVPMYDAKYPAESFFTPGNTLQGGVILNKSTGHYDSSDIGDSGDEIVSDSEFGRPIPFRTFDDVAGMDDSIDFMKRKLMYPIMYPNAFKGDKNHGIILYGPPGTGKTLLALATIGEIKSRQDKDVYFVKINSRDLEQQYVGVSEEKWRAVFDELTENQPAVLFIDEIDALMVDRNNVKDSSNNSMTSQVAQLLQSIDELEKSNAQVWIIGATNRPNAIDPAIKRSGRLGDSLEIKRPDEKGCRQILDLYLKDKKVSKKFDRNKFAKECCRLEYTGSDISQIVTEARNKMYDRCGITKKMDNGTYTDKDLDNLVYAQSDFDEALKTQQINKEIKRKIGFNT